MWAGVLLAVGLALAVGIGGCAGPGGEYTNSDLRFMLKPPPGWAVHEYSGQPCLFLLGPKGEGPGRPNVNVVVVLLDAGATLDETAAANKVQAEALKGYEAVSEETWTLDDGRRASVLEFRHTALGEPVTVEQLTAVADGRVYTVTAAARSDEFAAEKPAFDACLRSLRAGW